MCSSLNACIALRSLWKRTNSVLDVEQPWTKRRFSLHVLGYFKSFSSAHKPFTRPFLQDQLGVNLFPSFFLVPIFRNQNKECAT